MADTLGLTPEVVDVTVLLVRDTKDAYLTRFGQQCFNPFDVYIATLVRCAMPYVHGELHHGKAVLFQILAKQGGGLHVFLLFYRQIKEYEQPHDVIGIKSFFRHDIIGKASFFTSPLKNFANEAVVMVSAICSGRLTCPIDTSQLSSRVSQLSLLW